MAKSNAPSLASIGGQTTGRDELLSGLRSMVNKPASSDVEFRCSDGKYVCASRWLLANRSAVFEAMFSNGMLETTEPEIQPLDFTSQVMLPVFEFLYTGAIDSYPVTEWEMGFEILRAANVFMIPTLDSLAQEFLRRKVSSTDPTKGPAAMAMLCVGVDSDESWDEKNALLLELLDRVGNDWLHKDCFYLRSKKAVEFILCNSQRHSGLEEDKVCVEEYFTFRNIVLWHVYRVVSPGNVKARAAIEDLLPGRESPSLWAKMVVIPDSDSILSDLSMSNRSIDATVFHSLMGTNSYRDSLEGMLRHINLSRIPGSLLGNVIHPLKIIPLPKILWPLLRGGRGRPWDYSASESDWRHGPSCIVEKNGRIRCEAARGGAEGATDGVAIAAYLPVPSKKVYEWEFEILQDDFCAIDLGIVNRSVGQSFKMPTSLFDFENSRVARISEKRGHIDVMKGPSKYFAGRDRVSRVHFQLDKTEKWCRVRFNKSKAFVDWVWKDLSGGYFYPAVGFKDCKGADVQFKLVSGFNYY